MLDAVPGRVNAHTHLNRGLAPRVLPAGIAAGVGPAWSALAGALDPATLRASARLYLAEALLAGTTTLVDHHQSPRCLEGSLDVLADAAEELGVRVILCYAADEREGGLAGARRGLAECRRLATTRYSPLIRVMVGIHASFAVSDQTLVEAGDLCRELAIPLHLNLAEHRSDVADARARGYLGPLERLQALGALVPGSVLAHGVHLSEVQVAAAADRGCWLVHNARSNRAHKVGYAAALVASERVALGTDGYPADMLDEMSQAAAEGAAHGESTANAERRLDAGLALAAERFGTPPDGGADYVSEDGLTVIVAGRSVVDGGELLTADLGAIRAEAAVAASRLVV